MGFQQKFGKLNFNLVRKGIMSGIVKLIIGGVLFFMIVIVFFTPSESTSYNYNVQVNSFSSYASDGLDLQAVGSLLKDTESAADLEKKLNSASTGINNLDLNEDGAVDYIRVSEYGEGDLRGFSLSTELSPGDEQEIATIEVEKVGDQAKVQMHGNSQIYGPNHYHQSSFSFVDMLLLSYLFSPHTSYFSPFGYGYYPNYYNSYSTRSPDVYRSQNTGRTGQFKSSRSSNLSKKISSPNANKVSSRVKAPLKNPTSTQKSFQARNPSKSVRSGGFGKSSSSLSSPRPSYRSSGGFSGSSFGGK